MTQREYRATRLAILFFHFKTNKKSKDNLDVSVWLVTDLAKLTKTRGVLILCEDETVTLIDKNQTIRQ